MSKNCLNEETLASYLDDSLQVVARAAAEEHLVSCDACRSRLVYYMRILDDDIREEEEPVVAAAMEAWDPARIPAPVARGWLAAARSHLMQLALVASVVTAVALGAILGLYNPRPIETAELLEAQVRRERPFAARTSLQEEAEDWVALEGTRYPTLAAADNTDETGIGLEEPGADSPGYHLLGLQYLIGGDFDSAEYYLSEALLESDSDPEIQNDLGVTYMERSKRDPAATQMDYRLSRDYFRSAIQLDSDYLPAQFNLALLYDLMDTRSELVDQVATYLAADPDSGWAGELQEILGSDDF